MIQYTQDDIDKFRLNMVALIFNMQCTYDVFIPLGLMVSGMSSEVKLGDLAEKVVNKYNISTDLHVRKENLQPILDDFNTMMSEGKLFMDEIVVKLKEKYLAC